ncbi:ATP-binding cassette domain-containing protein [Streptomyces sp. M10(2022)]
MRGQWLISIYFPFVQLLASAAAAAVLIVGAGRVDNGTLTTGALVAYLLYIDLFFAPVQQLSQVFDGYQQATVSLRRIQELLQEPTSTADHAEPLDVTSLRGEIAFEGVSFAYGTAEGKQEEALSGVDLHIPAGQTVAFVGETGAGKSTLVKLVARFYDPTSGRVTADGTDLRKLDMTAYRHRLGVVPQEAYLFAGTVRDAIAYGLPGATDAQVEAAARAVGAHDMIATLEDGYLHEVAERGRNLRRPAPADRARTGGAGRPGHPAARRGDRLPRPGQRGTGQPGHRPAHRPAHHAGGGPSADDGRTRGPGCGDGPRAGRRGRHACRTARQAGQYARLWRTFIGEDTPAGV